MAILGSGWQENAVRYGTYGITVVAGLFASGIALGGALLNLDKQRELTERRHIAARSVLPLTLSNLYKLTETGFETVLESETLKAGPPEEALRRFHDLQLPKDDVRQIRDCIEAADPITQAIRQSHA